MSTHNLLLVFFVVSITLWNNVTECKMKHDTLARCTYSSSPLKPVIIFDFGGILGEISRLKVVQFIGMGTIMHYMYAFQRSPLHLTKSLYVLLDTMPAIRGNYCCMKDPYGAILPGLIVDWQCGLISSETLRVRMIACVERSCAGIEKKALLRMIDFLYNPYHLINAVIMCDYMVRFVRDLKKHGYYVCLVSNFDPETFALLEKKFHDIFSCFDDIIVSGRAGVVKPDNTIFDPLIKKYKGPFIFLDDQEENCRAARSLGINALYCPLKKSLFMSKKVLYAGMKRRCIQEIKKCFI